MPKIIQYNLFLNLKTFIFMGIFFQGNLTFEMGRSVFSARWMRSKRIKSRIQMGGIKCDKYESD